MVLALLRKQAGDIRDQWRDGNNWTDHARFQVHIREDLAAMTYEDLMQYLEDHFGDE